MRVRALMPQQPPLVMFGSINERMYLAEKGRRARSRGPKPFIPASFPGAVIRRATGTPFMGYAGATYLVQEFCNAVVRCPVPRPAAGHRMDQVRRPRRRAWPKREMPWEDEAQGAAGRIAVQREPVLVQISAAKQPCGTRAKPLATARRAERVTRELVSRITGMLDDQAGASTWHEPMESRSRNVVACLLRLPTIARVVRNKGTQGRFDLRRSGSHG